MAQEKGVSRRAVLAGIAGTVTTGTTAMAGISAARTSAEADPVPQAPAVKAVPISSTPWSPPDPPPPPLTDEQRRRLQAYATWLHCERVAVLEALEPMTPPGRRGGVTLNGAAFYHRSEPADATLRRSQMVLTTVGAAESGRRIKRTAFEQSELLDAYDEWLFTERRMLHLERFGTLDYFHGHALTRAAWFHFPSHEAGGWQGAPKPSTRAEAVLSTVGCEWHDDGGDAA